MQVAFDIFSCRGMWKHQKHVQFPWGFFWEKTSQVSRQYARKIRELFSTKHGELQLTMSWLLACSSLDVFILQMTSFSWRQQVAWKLGSGQLKCSESTCPSLGCNSLPHLRIFPISSFAEETTTLGQNDNTWSAWNASGRGAGGENNQTDVSSNLTPMCWCSVTIP